MDRQSRTSLLQVGDNLGRIFVTAARTLKPYEQNVRATANTASDSYVITLPHAVEVDRKFFSIRVDIANSKTVTITDPTGALSNIVLSVDNSFVVLFSDGEYWHSFRDASIVALTDNSGGAATSTVAAVAAPTGYTAVVNLTDPVTKAQGETMSAALEDLENDVTTAIGVINANFASLAAKINSLISGAAA